MNPDEFEQQLQRQPLRPVPPGWRAEILREAHESVAADVRRLDLPGHENESFTSAGTTKWRELFWPCPQAWAGLAAVWIVILILNMTTSSSHPEMATQAPKPSPEVETTLAAQRRELAHLLDNSGESGPKPKAPPGPRSESFSPPKV